MEEVKKKKTYRNFTRSEKAIVHAYVELMQKNKKITVTDIVNTADLNRSSFITSVWIFSRTSSAVLKCA